MTSADNHLRIEFTGLRVFGGGDPVVHNLFELHRRHAGVCDRDDLKNGTLATSKRPLEVTFK
jgi:hypothetical protein